MGTSPSKETHRNSTPGSSTNPNSININMKKRVTSPTKKGKGFTGSVPNQQRQRNNADEKEGNDGGTASTAASGLSVGVGNVESKVHMSNNGVGNPKRVLTSPRMYGSHRSERLTPSSVIEDETVKVNLAMADLMAYLQVVANNSSNLPLTKRDDPDLGKTVSTLTSEEYARKSAAFLPSDVKIISGSFTKYDNVWDLPTSEEFDPADSTQEPGISHGGACCNALLKVLYDTEAMGSEAPKVDYNNATSLFEEEDESFSLSFHSDGPCMTFDSLVLGDNSASANIAWTDLLRKMKVEMRTAGFFQVPAVTSSRKFDLKTPFSLVPPNFDPTKNKKRSLLIGCNYLANSEYSLKSCHDDIRSIKDFIVNVHGFPEGKGLMTILLDDDNHKHPTHTNITEAFKTLSEQSQPGDTVFVQFSGHGCRTLDSSTDSEVETYDEALIPSDYNVSGVIRDTLIFKTLLAPMRYGVTVTCLFDSCDTGIMVDLPYSWTAKSDRVESEPKMSLNEQFSFVRFLKVIKTLYESSTFTQLGRTVRSVLHEKKPNARVGTYDDDDHSLLDESSLGGSLITVESVEPASVPKKQSSLSIMNVLNACNSPPPTSPDRRLKSKNTENSTSTSHGPSLFQQVLLCGLSNPADYDDDYTFSRNNTDDDDYEGPSSFHTEEDYEYDRHNNRKSTSRSSTGKTRT